MDDIVQNNEENKEKLLGGITGKGFMPGVSGNPGGRPKGTMKNYLSRKFTEMSDEEKENFLQEHKVDGKAQIEFGEGKPETRTDITSGGEPITPLLVKFLDNDTNNGDTQGIRETI